MDSLGLQAVTDWASPDGKVRVLRVFPRRTSMTPTDRMAFVGDPPLWRPTADEVHISVAFSWDRAEGMRLRDAWGQHYKNVLLSGPAIDGEGGEFEPGLYLREGVTITSRGCIRRCPWCIVSDPIRLLEIKPGYIVQDNNILATGRRHLGKVLQMLRQQPQPAVFAGGLDATLLTDWMAEELRSLRIGQVFLAADTNDTLPALETALHKLSFLPRDKRRCYVLWAFGDESLEEGEARCRRVWEMGGLPFAQLYQPLDGFVRYPTEWRARARVWQRPAATKAMMLNEGRSPNGRGEGPGRRWPG